MMDGSSPGTSLMVSVTTRAGAQAAASRPPLMRDRCLRTQFISEMLAPLLSSSRLMRCLSSSVRPSAGSVSSAEPPPEIRHSTRSSGVRPCVQARMRCAAARPAASGTGCEASTTSMRCLQALGPRRHVVVARDDQAFDSGASAGHKASTACAIAPPALPAPSTRCGRRFRVWAAWAGSGRCSPAAARAARRPGTGARGTRAAGWPRQGWMCSG
jgi:hypothetical protein